MTAETRGRVRWSLVVGLFLALCGTIIAASVVRIYLDTDPVSRAERLVESGKIIGWSKEQLVREFGKPTSTDYFADWDIVFWIGPSSSYMAVDSSWLVVKVDGSGRVVAAKVVED